MNFLTRCPSGRWRSITCRMPTSFLGRQPSSIRAGLALLRRRYARATRSLSCRSASISLITPRGAVRLGVADVLPPERYTADTAAAALQCLLGDPLVHRRAAEVAAAIRAENGVAAACDIIEGVITETGTCQKLFADGACQPVLIGMLL